MTLNLTFLSHGTYNISQIMTNFNKFWFHILNFLPVEKSLLTKTENLQIHVIFQSQLNEVVKLNILKLKTMICKRCYLREFLYLNTLHTLFSMYWKNFTSKSAGTVCRSVLSLAMKQLFSPTDVSPLYQIRRF